MTRTPSPSLRPGLARRELVALCALLTFGCTVVRAPASAISPRVPVRDGVAEPQLELWLESGGPVSPAEAEAAADRARSALYQALAHRRLEEGDQLLVVRAQGVSRTPSRRDNQSAAVAGIVVGVVVVAVVAIAASKSGGRGGGVPSAGRAGPRSGVPRVVAAPPRPPRIGAPHAFPHHHHGGGPYWGLDLGVHLVVPLVPPPTPMASSEVWYGTPPPGAPAPPPEPVPPLAPAEPAPASQEALPVEPPPEAPLAELMLPPPPAMDLESRGFFAGDAVRAELLLVDRTSGEPLWMKVVESESDPCDAAKVKELLDGALDDPQGWVPAGAPSPPAP
ncbi:MAG: hypothetical protein HZB56_17655 [Deltaproteobacteria bacterium]|nr:hypothetical protein [Deltaproteobacteria bacterium]